MAKKHITVNTKEGKKYELSFELTKPVTITFNSNELITANSSVRYNIINQINKECTNTNLNLEDIESIEITCEKNINLNTKISNLKNSLDFIFPLLTNFDTFIQSSEVSLMGEYIIKLDNSSNFEPTSSGSNSNFESDSNY